MIGTSFVGLVICRLDFISSVNQSITHEAILRETNFAKKTEDRVRAGMIYSKLAQPRAKSDRRAWQRSDILSKKLSLIFKSRRLYNKPVLSLESQHI